MPTLAADETTARTSTLSSFADALDLDRRSTADETYPRPVYGPDGRRVYGPPRPLIGRPTVDRSRMARPTRRPRPTADPIDRTRGAFAAWDWSRLLDTADELDRPELFDGGAWVTQYGRPSSKRDDEPGAAYVGSTVAQPSDVRMALRSSVRWTGRGMVPTRAHETDETAGSYVDTGHHARRAATAFDTADGYNGTLNGEPVRWVHLRAGGAVWLHAVAGTPCPTELATGDPLRIVGAIAVGPRKTTRRDAIAIDVRTYNRLTREWETETRHYVPSWTRRTMVETGPRAERDRSRPIPGTARRVRQLQDDRTTSGVGISDERREQITSAQVAKRWRSAQALAAGYIDDGTIGGRRDSFGRVIAEASLVVGALSGADPRSLALSVERPV